MVALALATLSTWLIRRGLRRRRGGPPRNDLAEWNAVFGCCCVVFAVIGWVTLRALGLLGR